MIYHFQWTKWDNVDLLQYSSFGFVHIGRVGSAFATVTVTVERFIAVMYPLKKLRNTRILLSVPIIGSLFYNIPRFFEFKTSLVYFDGQNYFRFANDTNSTNLTVVSKKMICHHNSKYCNYFSFYFWLFVYKSTFFLTGAYVWSNRTP